MSAGTDLYVYDNFNGHSEPDDSRNLIYAHDMR